MIWREPRLIRADPVRDRDETGEKPKIGMIWSEARVRRRGWQRAKHRPEVFYQTQATLFRPFSEGFGWIEPRVPALRPSTDIRPKELTRDVRGFFNSLLAADKTGLAASGPPEAALHLPCLRLPSARSLIRRSGSLRRAPLSCGGPCLS
jgi:hypothetical protein